MPGQNCAISAFVQLNQRLNCLSSILDRVGCRKYGARGLGGWVSFVSSFRNGFIMVDPKRPDDDEGKPSRDDEADMSARLRRLDSRLGEISNGREGAAKAESRRSSDMSGLGQALRLSAEFISGVIAGGLLGWLFDWWLGTSPWGFIVGLFLGFGSGMLNMLRASGELNRKPTSANPPEAAERSEEDKRN
jgi:ATP synthase protein I